MQFEFPQGRSVLGQVSGSQRGGRPRGSPPGGPPLEGPPCGRSRIKELGPRPVKALIPVISISNAVRYVLVRNGVVPSYSFLRILDAFVVESSQLIYSRKYRPLSIEILFNSPVNSLRAPYVRVEPYSHAMQQPRTRARLVGAKADFPRHV
eukprot:747174-Prorocentrum_minimum.AAC.6